MAFGGAACQLAGEQNQYRAKAAKDAKKNAPSRGEPSSISCFFNRVHENAKPKPISKMRGGLQAGGPFAGATKLLGTLWLMEALSDSRVTDGIRRIRHERL